MDAVIDSLPDPEGAGASAEIIDFEAYRRARGLPAFAAASDEADAFPWAYTFDPPGAG